MVAQRGKNLVFLHNAFDLGISNEGAVLCPRKVLDRKNLGCPARKFKMVNNKSGGDGCWKTLPCFLKMGCKAENYALKPGAEP